MQPHIHNQITNKTIINIGHKMLNINNNSRVKTYETL